MTLTGRIWRLAAILAFATLAACGQPRPIPPPPAPAPMPLPGPEQVPLPIDPLAACAQPESFAGPAAINANSLRGLAWEPYRRQEIGWETYAPVIAREIGTPCPPHSPGFAAALAAWQQSRGMPADGVVSGTAFQVIKGLWQERRPFVMATLKGWCPDAPDPAGLAWATEAEGFFGKPIQLRAGALDAFRRMRAAALAEVPGATADPQFMTLFSGFRDPAADDARCETQQNCSGVARARCSAHRTGLAMDINMGYAPGFKADDSADENRRYMAQGAAYRWLVANAYRFGLVNYVFEPWHWEWIGEAP